MATLCPVSEVMEGQVKREERTLRGEGFLEIYLLSSPCSSNLRNTFLLGSYTCEGKQLIYYTVMARERS